LACLSFATVDNILVVKDYGKWHELKSYIEEHNGPLLFAEREIWWTSIGLNLGEEQDGKNEFFERPVLILKKFSKGIFWGLPTSSQLKDNEFNFQYSPDDAENTSILLSQLRVFSSKRLIRRVLRMNETEFNEIRGKIIEFLL
jgi:mRNA interferase MazF